MTRLAVPLARLVSTAVLGVVVGLVFWASLPVVLGWSAHAIMSGSMTPNIGVGDVVSSAPVDTSNLRAGMVVLFHDPLNQDVVLAHRIREVEDDGTFVTRGDANQSDDPARVSPSEVIGLARLRVPYVGLIHVWFEQGRYALVAAPLIAIAGCAVLATWSPRNEDGDRDGEQDGGQDGVDVGQPQAVTA